jgi:O-antigen/teichoic acid export membrane protein
MITVLCNSGYMIKKYTNESLYRNSFFLIVTRYFNLICGFLFWIVAARSYSIEDVGLATVLIASLELVSIISKFGIDFSLIRFLPLRNKINVLSTALIIVSVSSSMTGIGYIFLTNLFSPNAFLNQKIIYKLLFIIFAVMASVVSITGQSFIALKKGNFYFYQNICFVSKLIFLISLVFLGSLGIFFSIGFSYLLASLFSIIVIHLTIGLRFFIDKKFIKEAIGFSLGNYIADLLFILPSLIMPIIVINILGDTETAKFAIAFSIGNLILVIPDALGTSLFVEGSNGGSLRDNAAKAIFIIYILVTLLSTFIYLFGGLILSAFGKNYTEASELLKIFALTSFLIPIYTLFIPIQNVRMEVRSIIKLNSIRFFLLISLSYIMMKNFGIIGIGYAWMLTYGILVLMIIVFLHMKGWTSDNRANFT